MDPRDQARQVGSVDSWLGNYKSSAALTNPGAGAVGADTAGMTGGFYDVHMWGASSIAQGVNGTCFQWRNAANTADILWWYLMSSGAQSWEINLKNVYVLANERFRSFCPVGFTGRFDTAILAVRRA